MTDAQSAQTALDKLIEAVEAGGLDSIWHGCSSRRGHWAYETGLNAEQRNKSWYASHGSLDAALALHEALLPGRTLSVGQNAHYGDWNAWVRYAEDGEILDEYTAASDTAARSLLLAILRAYRSVQQ